MRLIFGKCLLFFLIPRIVRKSEKFCGGVIAGFTEVEGTSYKRATRHVTKYCTPSKKRGNFSRHMPRFPGDVLLSAQFVLLRLRRDGCVFLLRRRRLHHLGLRPMRVQAGGGLGAAGKDRD